MGDLRAAQLQGLPVHPSPWRVRRQSAVDGLQRQRSVVPRHQEREPGPAQDALFQMSKLVSEELRDRRGEASFVITPSRLLPFSFLF